MKEGQYVLIWNVKISEGVTPVPGLSNQILGDDARVPQVGGQVLMGDASIRALNVQQFQAMPKATPAKPL